MLRWIENPFLRYDDRKYYRTPCADESQPKKMCGFALVRLILLPLLAAFLGLCATVSRASEGETWRSADDAVFTRSGVWEWTTHRYAAQGALVTQEDGAALEFEFRGAAAVLVLDTLTPPNNFGPPELGALEVWVDGKWVRTLRPRIEDREVVLLRSSGEENKQIRLVHRRDGTGTGVRINGVRMINFPSGDLTFILSGQHNGALVDVRAIVKQDGRKVRDVLLRNWLTGQCRIAALPPGKGYSLELRAAGWITGRVAGISIRSGEECQLPPIYLVRAWDVPVDEFKFPALGQPVVRLAGQSFRARFEAYKTEINAVRVIRRHGPATISRQCLFNEDKAVAFYYHREGVITLPVDTPSGLYDIEVSTVGVQGRATVRSRRSVWVTERFSPEPVFVSFGHLDTWGQGQAEYMAQLAEMANIIAPDMVLVSNEANPAYAAGALYALEVPHVINFGNHRAPEPGTWYGTPTGIVDFGTEFTVLNFGNAWDAGTVEADQLLAKRTSTKIKVINAFEANAPLPDFLDKHGVALIHYAHGPGPVVAKLGATPTLRVGKSNSESFRIIRFKGSTPVAYTYLGHATAPIPFLRGESAPIRATYHPENDGSHSEMTALLENDLAEPIPDARAVFVLPRGVYDVAGGRIEQVVFSDDGIFTVLAVRTDLPAESAVTISVRPAESI